MKGRPLLIVLFLLEFGDTHGLFYKGRTIRAAILNINISPIFKGRLILKPKKIRADT